MVSLIRKRTQISGNDYISIMKLNLNNIEYKTFLFHFREENTNAIKFKILASSDQITWETIKEETTLAKNGSTYETLTDAWMFIDIQFKADTPEAQGKLTLNVSGN
jgi:hypothetical protein